MAVLIGCVQPPPPDNKVKVYLFAGQSNMPQQVVDDFNSLMSVIIPGRVHCILTSQSGASMLGETSPNDWKVSETSGGIHYDDFKNAILTDLAAIVSAGKIPDIRGLSWRQGEAERDGVSGYTNVTLQSEYELQLGRLFKYLIDDINEAGYDTHNMRIIVQRIHATLPTTDPTMLTAIRAAHVNMTNFTTNFPGYNIKKVDWMDTDSFDYDPVALVHYTTLGQQQSATALYNYFIPYINEVNTLPTIDTSGFDSDAIAFLSASKIISQTQANAINTYVVALKSASQWVSTPAIYPMIGGNRIAHRTNLKNPANTDGAFRLTFNKSCDHLPTGFQGDGIAGYANTYLPLNSLGQNTIGVFLYSHTSGQSAKYGFGSVASGNACKFTWGIRWTDDKNYASCNGGEITGNTTTDGSGVHIMSRTSSSNFNTYITGTKKTNSSTSSAPDATTITIGGRNLAGVVDNFSSRIWSNFGILNASLSDSDELAIRNAVNALEAIR